MARSLRSSEEEQTTMPLPVGKEPEDVIIKALGNEKENCERDFSLWGMQAANSQGACASATIKEGLFKTKVFAVSGAVVGVGEVCLTGLWNKPKVALHAVAASTLRMTWVGGALAVFSGAICSARVARGVDDIYNTGIGGVVAGSLLAMPSRSPTNIARTACGFAGIMMAFESALKYNFTTAPKQE